MLFVLWLMVRASTGDRFVPIVDHANLAFHEAGHLLVGLVSDRLSVYGGTFGQLVFPLAFVPGLVAVLITWLGAKERRARPHPR